MRCRQAVNYSNSNGGSGLNALQERIEVEAGEDSMDRVAEIVKKLDGLRRRIAWGRVAKVLITSVATQGLALPALIDALTPAPPSGKDDKGVEKLQSMAGFREDFEALMNTDLGLTRVVVLVDDLDRCLPASAVSTLEAIKLFLSVKKVAFVLAADEGLVRASINSHLGDLAQGEFANRYTEKIVQIPMSLPRLSQRDAEALVALLLAGQAQMSNMSGAENKAMIARARDRRRAGEAPYAVDDPDGGPGPTGEQQRLASVISRGLSADKWQTPRAVKRFLNNLAIREQIADEAGAHLTLDVLVKMYLLELRHLPEFKILAGLAQTCSPCCRCCPESPGRPVRPWNNHRRTLEGIAWRFRTGSPWRDLPSEFGAYQSVWERHRRWPVDRSHWF